MNECTVVLANPEGQGFSLAALQSMLSLDHVSRVDGHKLTEKGRFIEMAVHLENEDLAEQFISLAREMLDTEFLRLN